MLLPPLDGMLINSRLTPRAFCQVYKAIRWSMFPFKIVGRARHYNYEGNALPTEEHNGVAPEEREPGSLGSNAVTIWPLLLLKTIKYSQTQLATKRLTKNPYVVEHINGKTRNLLHLPSPRGEERIWADFLGPCANQANRRDG